MQLDLQHAGKRRAGTAADELAGGRVSGRRRAGGARVGGHERRVLLALRLQAHHLLRRCVQPLERRRLVSPRA